jgi:hypothetical protein
VGRKQSPLVINIRGNSGSGKTHLTREFMKKFRVNVPAINCYERIEGYVTQQRTAPLWAVIGKYENACGGCDTIKTQLEVVRRVEFFTGMGYNVWLEGLIMSTIYGTVGAYSEKFGDRWVFAYLDTPENICFQRIRERRRLAGNTKPLNEKNTANRFATIVRNREIVESHGRRTLLLDYRNPLPTLLKIIKKEG